MKKLILMIIMTVAIAAPAGQAQAQIPIVDIIKEAVKKVIKAVDLQIQRQQNKVIWLQNAQKTLENTMAKLKLDEISQWTEKQRTLYKDYFEELSKVKNILVYYRRVKEIAELQVRIVQSYKHAWGLLRRDENFTAAELDHMQRVYSGILDESIKNIDRIYIIVNSFQTQMSDAKRLELINAAATDMETNYHDLSRFNQQNMILSLQRAKTQKDVNVIKEMYGLE